MAAVITSEALQAIFAQPSPEGGFDAGTLRYFQALAARRSVLLLAFAPKAAGTFFRQAAMYAIGGDLHRMSHAQGGRDGAPYLPTLIACHLDDSKREVVAHIHMQAFTANRHLLAAFGIRPVIMLRDLPDTLASYWDMLESDPVARAMGLNSVTPPNFLQMSRDAKADFILDIIAPWYVSYFASWKSFVDEDPTQVCVLRYRDFRQDPQAALESALAHAGFTIKPADCQAALAHAWSERSSYRFNKGTEGRGKAYFPPDRLAELSRKLALYSQLRDWMPDLMGTAQDASQDCAA